MEHNQKIYFQKENIVPISALLNHERVQKTCDGNTTGFVTIPSSSVPFCVSAAEKALWWLVISAHVGDACRALE